MSAIVLSSVQRQQPQHAAPIDAGNPLARALVYAKSNPGNSAPATVGASNSTAPLATEAKIRGLSTRFTGYGGGTVDTIGSIGRGARGTVLVLHQSTILPPNGGFPNPGYSHVLAATISGTTSANGWLLMLGNGNGNLQFRMFDAKDNGQPVASADGNVPLNDGRPHVTVATWGMTTSDSLATYVDGIPYASSGALTAGVTIQQPMRIGGSRESQQFWGKLDGNIYLVLVWDRVLSPAEIKSVSENPWQIFQAPTRRLWVASTDIPATASANLAWTEASDSASLTAIETNAGTVAWNEGGDAAAISATAKDSAALGWTEASDTTTAAALVTDRGAAAWTEQGDAMSIAGTAAMPAQPTVTAAVAWAEAADVMTSAAAAVNRGAVAWTEAGDSMSAAAQVADRGTIAWTDGDDTASLAGTVATRPPDSISAGVAWTEGSDTAAVVARATDRITIGATEQGDIWSLQGNAGFVLSVRYADSTIMRFSRLQAVANLGPDRLQQTTGFP